MGIALAVNEVAIASKHERPKPSKDGSLDDSFRLIIHNVLDHIRANIAPAQQGDAEGVHQLRIGVRRARATLRLYRIFLPANMFSRFDRRLQNFGHMLGEARDWDVLLTETVKEDWPEVKRVREGAMEQQRHQQQQVHVTLTQPHFSNLVERLGVWADSIQFADVTIGEMAPKMMERLAQTVQKRRKKADEDDHETLHRLRKSVKWLRYATEFIGTLYGEKKVRRYLSAVKEAMDQLGAINDAMVAGRLLAKINLTDELQPTLNAHRKRVFKQAPDALTNLKLKAFWS